LADAVTEGVGTGVAWLTMVLVLVVCYDVFTRYVLQNSLVAVQELQWHLFALIFLLGAGYTLKHDKHVRFYVFFSVF
jgi:TRAP-type mannitol/chloroaromatic compound transport system permease small subunit